MHDQISVKSQRLNLLLVILSAYLYFRLYWGIYYVIVFECLAISVEAATVLDMVFIAVFVISFVPVVYFLKKSILRLLTS